MGRPCTCAALRLVVHLRLIFLLVDELTFTPRVHPAWRRLRLPVDKTESMFSVPTTLLRFSTSGKPGGLTESDQAQCPVPHDETKHCLSA